MFHGLLGALPAGLCRALLEAGDRRAGAIASILAAVASWVYLFRRFELGRDTDYLFLGMMPAATIVFVSAATLIVVSLVTRPPAKEVIERFFPEEE